MIVNINPDLQDLHGKPYERWMAPALFSVMYSGLYDLVIMINDSPLDMADMLIDARETFWKDFEKSHIGAYDINVPVIRERLVRHMLIYPEITPGYAPPRLMSEIDLKFKHETWVDNARIGNIPHFLLVGSPLPLLLTQAAISAGKLQADRVRMVYCSRSQILYILKFDKTGKLGGTFDGQHTKIFPFSRLYSQRLSELTVG